MSCIDGVGGVRLAEEVKVQGLFGTITVVYFPSSFETVLEICGNHAMV
jgi:hypothetical protein